RIPAGAGGAALTCPRCLGRIEASAGQDVTPGRDGSADAEAWWDTKGAGLGLIILAALGLLGLLFFAVGDTPFPHNSTEWTLVLVTGALFLAVLGAAVVEVRKPEDPAAQGLARLRAPARETEKHA